MSDWYELLLDLKARGLTVSPYAYFRIGTRAARRLSEALYRVRLGYRNDEALKAVDPDAAVVFVINHRSNMDYVLVTYVAASSSALSYAVGEWALNEGTISRA